MAKLNPGAAEKLKNMARGLKNDNAGGIKGVADKIKQQSEGHQKNSISDGKVSGRKN